MINTSPIILNLKPNKDAFLLFNLVKGMFLSLIILGIIGIILFVLNPIFIFGPIVLFVLLNAFSFIVLLVRYKKEKYEFYSDKIVYKSGGLFSDNENELIIKNVTYVGMRLPFIEHFFLRLVLYKFNLLEVQVLRFYALLLMMLLNYISGLSH